MPSPTTPPPGQPDPAALLALGLATQAADAGASSAPPLTPDELAAEFPRLEILELLGRGGMGAVYKARQRDLDRFVALKILRPGLDADPGFAERFTREARALAQLNHPGIVTLYEFGKTPAGRYFILMEFVDGVNLRQLLAAGRLSPREALAIVPPLCDALQYAHDRGLIHRDIKPENLLIDRLGRIKIADFGIAKITTAKSETSTSVEIAGTPAYMAPEQRDHPSEVDHRADLYALGVVFYQMLTGELPSADQLRPPSTRVQLDVRLDEIVLRALEKDPARRYAAASDFKTQVETVTSAPAPAAQPASVPISANSSLDEADPTPGHSWRDLGWSLVPLVALLLVFFNQWGSRAWLYFGVGCAALTLIPSWGLRFRLPRISPRYTRALAIAPMVICVLGTAVYFFKRHASPAPQAWNLDVIVTDQSTWPPKTLPPDRALPVAGAALALLGSSDVRQPGTLEEWQTANAGPHLRLEYPRASEGKMPDVIVITLPLKSGVIWTRKAEKITRHSNLSATAAEKLKTLLDQAEIQHTLLDEPVKLRAINWLDKAETTPSSAWLPDGGDIPADEKLLPFPRTNPTTNPNLRFLCIWFSHPQVDLLSVAEVKLFTPLDASKGPVFDPLKSRPLLFEKGNTSRNTIPAKAPQLMEGWWVFTTNLDTSQDLAADVIVRLRYSLGPWRIWEQVNIADFRAPRVLDYDIMLGMPAEDPGNARPYVEIRSTPREHGVLEQWDVVALTRDGQRLERYGSNGTTEGKEHVERLYFNAPLSQLRALEIRKRPIRTHTWKTALKNDAHPSVAISHAWLRNIDQGGYAESWLQSGALFQKSITKEAWITALETTRSPLKKVYLRHLKSVTETNQLPGIPDGRYVVLQFTTQFSVKDDAIETLTLSQEPDDVWRPIGYFIK